MHYADLEPYVLKTISGKENALSKSKIIKVGLTSGTTGKHGKKIPYNLEMINLFNTARVFSVASILREHPDFLKKFPHILSITASNEVYTENGLSFGYVSGIINEFEPRVMRGLFYPRSVELNKMNWDQRLNLIYNQTKGVDLKILAGIPAILIETLEALCDFYKVQSLQSIFPHLEFCVYGGTDIFLYQERINALCGRALRYYPTYTATEGPIGLPYKATANISQYLLNPNLIINFLTEKDDSPLLNVTELKEGGSYRVVLTAPNGFLHYPLGDVIKVESINPYFTFSIVGRQSGGLNLASEKITEEKLIKAIDVFMKKINLNQMHFVVTPYKEQNQFGYHFILFVKNKESLDRKLFNNDQSCQNEEYEWKDGLEKLLDAILCEQNQDYRELRSAEVLGAVQISLLESGLVSNYFRETSNNGQIKIPMIFKNRNDLIQYMNEKVHFNIEGEW